MECTRVRPPSSKEVFELPQNNPVTTDNTLQNRFKELNQPISQKAPEPLFKKNITQESLVTTYPHNVAPTAPPMEENAPECSNEKAQNSAETTSQMFTNYQSALFQDMKEPARTTHVHLYINEPPQTHLYKKALSTPPSESSECTVLEELSTPKKANLKIYPDCQNTSFHTLGRPLETTHMELYSTKAREYSVATEDHPVLQHYVTQLPTKTNIESVEEGIMFYEHIESLFPEKVRPSITLRSCITQPKKTFTQVFPGLKQEKPQKTQLKKFQSDIQTLKAELTEYKKLSGVEERHEKEKHIKKILQKTATELCTLITKIKPSKPKQLEQLHAIFGILLPQLISILNNWDTFLQQTIQNNIKNAAYLHITEESLSEVRKTKEKLTQLHQNLLEAKEHNVQDFKNLQKAYKAAFDLSISIEKRQLASEGLSVKEQKTFFEETAKKMLLSLFSNLAKKTKKQPLSPPEMSFSVFPLDLNTPTELLLGYLEKAKEHLVTILQDSSLYSPDERAIASRIFCSVAISLAKKKCTYEEKNQLEQELQLFTSTLFRLNNIEVQKVQQLSRPELIKKEADFLEEALLNLLKRVFIYKNSLPEESIPHELSHRECIQIEEQIIKIHNTRPQSTSIKSLYDTIVQCIRLLPEDKRKDAVLSKETLLHDCLALFPLSQVFLAEKEPIIDAHISSDWKRSYTLRENITHALYQLKQKFYG